MFKKNYVNYTFLPELTSSILVAEIREPPHVAQANSKTNAGHDKVHLSGPGFSLHRWYRYRPISSPSCSPVLGLRWASPSTVTTPRASSRHRHQGSSRPPALLLRQGPCLHLGEDDFTWIVKDVQESDKSIEKEE